MIGLNDFKAQWASVRADVLSAVERVGASGWYILGTEVNRFEVSLAAGWGLPFAVGVGNGMDAIEIGLRCLGLKPGEKVLTTPLSAFATTLAIMRCGGVPVFVDTDETGLIDLGRSRAALVADPSIRFFVPVHLFGHALDLDAMKTLRDEFELLLLEDCAQAIGAAWKGRAVGTVGQVAAVSFYPTKNLGALGDGGALLTADAEIAAKARALRHYGQTSTYRHDEIGLNSRLDELQAAILTDAQLPRLQAWGSRRGEIARAYGAGIRAGVVSLPEAPTGSDSVWHLFPVRVAEGRREAFREFLASRGIGTGVHYPLVIPDQKALQTYSRFEVVGRLETAGRFAATEVSLPIHPFLQEADVLQVAAAISDWEG